jgi:hypothetical protein
MLFPIDAVEPKKEKHGPQIHYAILADLCANTTLSQRQWISQTILQTMSLLGLED